MIDESNRLDGANTPHDPHERGTPPGMSPVDVTMRSEVGRFLGKECWPADKERLIEVAESNHAPEEITDLLRRLDSDREYVNLADAWEQLGGHNESRRT